MAGQSDDSPKSNLIEPMTFLKIIIASVRLLQTNWLE